MQTIFVQISSYRDRECQWTVKDLFAKATNPERVFVGICWQFVPEEDQDCFVEPYPYPQQVRVADFHARDAKGLGWARGESQRLWQGEDYVLQIDSHMRFVEGWDQKMVDMQHQCGERSVLTLYPPGYTPPDEIDEWRGAHVQAVKSFNPEGVIGFTAYKVPEELSDRPQATAALAGGFIFGPGSIVRDIPADPDLFFYGEEPSLAARLWTHGYDLFSPHIPLIYHYYIRKESSRPWDDDPGWHKRHLGTLKRLKAMFTPALCTELDEKIELGDLGLGSVRTLAEYERFSGINFAGRTIASYARKFPYVYSDRAVFERTDVKLNSDAHLLFLGDDGVLFIEGNGSLVSLNTAATFVWCALEEGLSDVEIEQQLARMCSVDAATAKQQYQALLGHFDGLGLLSRPDQEMPTSEAPADRTETAERKIERVERDWYAIRYYRLLDSVIQVHYASQEISDWAHKPLAHLEIPEQQMANWDFRVVDTDEGFEFYVNDYWTAADQSMMGLFANLKFVFMRCAMTGYPYSVHLHAAGVSNGQLCLLLPAEKGSGKTTLAAAMMERGYQYLSDEVALLESADCHVRPFPVSLCVKQHAMDVLSPLYPQLSEQQTYARADGETVRYLAPPQSALGDDRALPAEYLVFPRYLPQAQTELHPITPGDALKRLLHDSQSIPEPLGLDDARKLVEWLNRAHCYEMPHSDLRDAVSCLEKLLPLVPSKTFSDASAQSVAGAEGVEETASA